MEETTIEEIIERARKGRVLYGHEARVLVAHYEGILKRIEETLDQFGS